MTRIALTGNIASGKSAVSAILQENGYDVLDTDDVAHKLLTVKNVELYDAFKNYDVFEDGEFSRKKLGELIFHDNILRKKLERILHPQIRAEIEKFDGIVAIPLLFEAGMQDLFDKIIMVYTDDDIRLKRLMSRNNLTEEDAKMRMNSQTPQDKKVNLCDYVIYNNGTVEELKQTIIKLMHSNFDRQ